MKPSQDDSIAIIKKYLEQTEEYLAAKRWPTLEEDKKQCHKEIIALLPREWRAHTLKIVELAKKHFFDVHNFESREELEAGKGFLESQENEVAARASATSGVIADHYVMGENYKKFHRPDRRQETLRNQQAFLSNIVRIVKEDYNEIINQQEIKERLEFFIDTAKEMIKNNTDQREMPAYIWTVVGKIRDCPQLRAIVYDEGYMNPKEKVRSYYKDSIKILLEELRSNHKLRECILEWKEIMDTCEGVARLLRKLFETPTDEEIRTLTRRQKYTKNYLSEKNPMFERLIKRELASLESDQPYVQIDKAVKENLTVGVDNLYCEIERYLKMNATQVRLLDIIETINVFNGQQHQYDIIDNIRHQMFKTATILYARCLAKSVDKDTVEMIGLMDLLKAAADDLRIIETSKKQDTVICYARSVKTGQLTRGFNLNARRFFLNNKLAKVLDDKELNKQLALSHDLFPLVKINYEKLPPDENGRTSREGLTFEELKEKDDGGKISFEQKACAEPHAISQQDNPEDKMILVAVRLKNKRKQMVALPCETSCQHLPNIYSMLKKAAHIARLFKARQTRRNFLSSAFRVYERNAYYEKESKKFIDTVGREDCTIIDKKRLPSNKDLFLDKPGTLSFCNNLVHCFRASSIGQKMKLSNNDSDGPYKLLAKLINSKGKKSCETLIQHLKAEKKVNIPLKSGQHAVEEFYYQLISQLPVQIRNQFTFGSQVKRTCKTCQPVENPEKQQSLLSLLLPEAAYMSFFDLIRYQEESTKLYAKCRQCNRQTSYTKKFIIKIPETCSRLVLSIPLRYYPDEKIVIRKTPTITSIETELHMYGANWKLAAAIEYRGKSPTDGPHVAWVRSPEGWDRIEDTTITTHNHASFVENMSKIHMLWFDRTW